MEADSLFAGARLAASGSGPLYRQVKRELQGLIERGRYAPGDTLPSESVISRALGVSVGTLRRAVDELVHENILVRRQGRGTFVALHGHERFLFQFFHVEPRLDAPHVPRREREFPVVECIGFARGRADETEAAALLVHAGEPVWRIDNRLSLGGQPVVHDRIVIPAASFKGIAEKRFRERPSTVYSFYQTEFGITVLRVQERARAVSASVGPARILRLDAGAPILEVHRIALTFNDKPVEYRVSSIHTAAHDYVSVLSTH
ncbi:MAG TPA: GntR family transcriptional regulator [Ramlibacter sp.]|uniref:GntR family transcriptional regulator n=1 Tax=Ramlibacter sp. TaxID=1917967 RepID=UPI002BC8C509|nr:GntR family transcriptional regulator [Ramlibacter sp.]HVZ42477.1 GntR family transcriptional regulator [Ramlibacter sp.]